MDGSSSRIVERIQQGLRKLPEDKAGEVLDFVDSWCTMPGHSTGKKSVMRRGDVYLADLGIRLGVR